MRLTFLGTGTSFGVPQIGCACAVCRSADPRDKRTRSGAAVQANGATILIDTPPELRLQLTSAGIDRVDAVLFTHDHADHLHGIDDVRSFVYKNQHRMPVWGDPITMQRVLEGFGYCFETPEGSSYPPICRSKIIADLDAVFEVEGPGGSVPLLPLWQQHGETHSLGFRIGDIAYCTDVSDFPEASVAKLADLDILIIDSLQYKHHPSHLSLEQALGWIEKIAPKRAILTHMHTPLDYDVVMAQTPDHVAPAFDQMSFEVEVQLPI